MVTKNKTTFVIISCRCSYRVCCYSSSSSSGSRGCSGQKIMGLDESFQVLYRGIEKTSQYPELWTGVDVAC